VVSLARASAFPYGQGMSLVEALVLGVVQGITEFLPISSTAHLRIVPALLGWGDPGAAYSAIIQLGTTAAVVGYFAKDIGRVAKAFFSALGRGTPFATPEARMGWAVILGTLPVVALGLLFKKAIENQLRSLYVIAGAAIGLAVVLYLAERAARHRRTIGEVTLVDGIAVGFAQAMALIPGSSRSGVTLTGGLFMGFTREAAARLSFLLSIPATAAAGLYELRHVVHTAKQGEALAPLPLVVGTLASFAFGWLAIAGLLRFLQTRTTLVFIVYRVALGAGLLLLLYFGILSP
jgi:undecaprenyl-diphosphatase